VTLLIDLTEPLQFDFFVRAVIAATMVGALTGLVGVYVVLRRMSYIGHGMSHAVFGGAVVGYVAGFNYHVAAGLHGGSSRPPHQPDDAKATDQRRCRHRHRDDRQFRQRRPHQPGQFVHPLRRGLFGNLLGVTSTAWS
jgi:hypothetical protein